MKHSFLAALTALALIAAVPGQGGTPLYEDDATFYISFDGETPTADLSEGAEKPFHIFGKAQFRDGLSGKALLCGQNGAKLRFDRKDILSFDKPGTIVFFYKGVDWEKNSNWPRIFFWGIESNQGYIGGQIANDPKTLCPCKRQIHTMFLYGKRIPSKVYCMNSDGESGCCKWHMLAFSWAPGQLRVNYDKNPGKVFPLNFDMDETDFPTKNFSIGSDGHWEYLLDEFAVYGRRLSDAELAEIYTKIMGEKK